MRLLTIYYYIVPSPMTLSSMVCGLPLSVLTLLDLVGFKWQMFGVPFRSLIWVVFWREHNNRMFIGIEGWLFSLKFYLFYFFHTTAIIHLWCIWIKNQKKKTTDGARIFPHGEPKQEIFLNTQEYVIKWIDHLKNYDLAGKNKVLYRAKASSFCCSIWSGQIVQQLSWWFELGTYSLNEKRLYLYVIRASLVRYFIFLYLLIFTYINNYALCNRYLLY